MLVCSVRNVLTADRGSGTAVAGSGGSDSESTYASLPPFRARNARNWNVGCDGRRPRRRGSFSSRPQSTAISKSQTACVPAWQAHHDQRKGTTSLFAALNIASGEVAGKGYRHHCVVNFKKFLTLRDQSVPETHEVHRILDNYGTHKTALIHNGLRRRPRYPQWH